MADFQLNSNIPLLAQVPDVIGAGERGFQFGQSIQQAPVRNQLLQQQADAGIANQQIRQQQIAAEQARVVQAEKNRVITSVASGAVELVPLLEQGDFAAAETSLETRLARLKTEGRDTRLTEQALAAVKSRDATQIQNVKKIAKATIEGAERLGLLETKAGGTVSAEQRGFENLIADFSDEEQAQARRVKAGLIAKAGDSAAERAARDEALGNQIVELERRKEAAKAEAKEVGSAKGKLRGAPLVAKAEAQIAAAVKIATTEAAARGEALTDLRKAEAGLPGLEEVVGKLRELSSIATFTITGKAFNLISKELGFGSTKGGTARAAYQATIDNQVLPLLKQTFGAAMTEGEGKRLAATLGDVDATPEAKQAQLDAFLDSQRRQIDNLNREIGVTGEAVTPTAAAAVTPTAGAITLPNGIVVRQVQ